MASRLTLPFNRRYGFGGELPLKLLLIDDWTGRPDARPLDDRRESSVDLASLAERRRDLRPAEDGATVERWARLEALLTSLEAASSRVVVELFTTSADDLAADFEDWPTLAKSSLYKVVDGGVYNWPGSPARAPYSAIVLGFEVGPKSGLSRSLAALSERTLTPIVSREDAVTMAQDFERTGWPLDPHGPDPRAPQFAAWALVRALFLLQASYGSRAVGLAQRFETWLDMHATMAHRGRRQHASGTELPLLDAEVRIEGERLVVEARVSAPEGKSPVAVGASVDFLYPPE